MTSKTKQIGLILLLGLLLPVLFITFYEIYSLSKTEEELTEIYDQQLSSITFAANQYSDDIIQNWLYELNTLQNYSYDWTLPYLKNHRSMDGFYLYDVKKQGLKNMGWHISDSTLNTETIDMEGWVEENQGLIEKLERYFEVDYQKKIPVSLVQDSSRWILVCMIGKPKGNQALCAMVIDIKQFTYEVVGPRLQQLSGDQFVFIVHDIWSDQSIFTTQKNFFGTLVRSEEMWILPHHKLYIYTQTTTIEISVRNRASTQFWLLLGTNVFILFAIWLVFRNFRRQMKLAQYKSDFVSSVSHELRTPLALIRMFAETLELGRVPNQEKKDEYYRIIRQESERLTGIVNKILNFSEMESGKRVFDIQVSPPCELVKDVMYTYEYHLQQKGFTWKTNIPEDMPELMLDKDAISEALVNLIDNAVKYSKENKHIDISLIKKEKEVGLAVSDQGIGIGEEHQKAIFDKFFRVTKGSLYSVQGTGLGLSLVQDIMKAHKGRISLESQVGKGSTFTLWFPIPQNNTNAK